MTVLVAGPIFLLLPFFVWRYQYGNPPAEVHAEVAVFARSGIAAWSGPVMIVIVLSYFVWRDVHRLDPYRPLTSTQAPLRVQAIGYDWKWCMARLADRAHANWWAARFGSWRTSPSA